MSQVSLEPTQKPVRLSRNATSRDVAPITKPQPDGTLVKALGRAWRWHKLLDEGGCMSASEIGDAENISKSYVSRILRLALLAPGIIDAILGGGRLRT